MPNKRLTRRSTTTFPARILTAVFGALPATIFSWFALLAIWVGILTLMRGGVVILAIGIAGIYGAVSLWAVVYGKVSKAIVVGLIAGLMAMMLPLLTPSSIVPDMLGISGRTITTYIEASPVVVALLWLGYVFLRSGARENVSKDGANTLN